MEQGTTDRLPLGVILAGGASIRLGTSKPLVELAGKPLVEYPLAALRAALSSVVVVAKSDVSLAGGVEVWLDGVADHHPLAGVVAAMRRTDCARVLVCACDMPFVTAKDVKNLASAAPDAKATVAVAAGVMQPQFAVYRTESIGQLESALEQSISFTAAATKLQPHLYECSADVLFNVNTPKDLVEAERRLTSG